MPSTTIFIVYTESTTERDRNRGQWTQDEHFAKYVLDDLINHAPDKLHFMIRISTPKNCKTNKDVNRWVEQIGWRDEYEGATSYGKLVYLYKPAHGNFDRFTRSLIRRINVMGKF